MRTYMISADARLNETRALLTTLNTTFSQYALQIRHILQSIFRTNVAILNAILFARFRFDIPISICWDQPVNFQDATGRRLPINVGFINSWEVFAPILHDLNVFGTDNHMIVIPVCSPLSPQRLARVSCCRDLSIQTPRC